MRRGFEPRDARAWLFGIAHNACSTVLRVRARNAREQTRPADEIDQAFGRTDPDRDRLFGLTRAIDSLPEKQKRALLLREWRGLSYEEVASELDVSLAAAETLIFRARNSVAAALDPAGHPTWRARLTAVGVAPLAFGEWTRGAVKSLFTSPVGTTKWALGFALIATAPLMIFGLAEGPLERMGEGSRVEAAPGEPPPSMSVPLPAATGGVASPVRPDPARQPNGPTAGGGVAGVTTEAARAEPIPELNPQPVAPPISGAPSPPPVAGEPSAGNGGAVKVTICQKTGGGKTVTISIAEPALPAHLAHGDVQGACS